MRQAQGLVSKTMGQPGRLRWLAAASAASSSAALWSAAPPGPCSRRAGRSTGRPCCGVDDVEAGAAEQPLGHGRAASPRLRVAALRAHVARGAARESRPPARRAAAPWRAARSAPAAAGRATTWAGGRRWLAQAVQAAFIGPVPTTPCTHRPRPGQAHAGGQRAVVAAPRSATRCASGPPRGRAGLDQQAGLDAHRAGRGAQAAGGAGLDALVVVGRAQALRRLRRWPRGARSRASPRCAGAATASARAKGSLGSQKPHSMHLSTKRIGAGSGLRFFRCDCGSSFRITPGLSRPCGSSRALMRASPQPPVHPIPFRRRAPCCGRCRVRPSASRRSLCTTSWHTASMKLR
jgi:hypothetical protein